MGDAEMAEARRSRTGNVIRIGIIVVLTGTLALYFGALVVLGPDRGYSPMVDGILGDVVLGLPALVCWARAVSTRARRWPYLLIGTAAAAFTAGNIAYVTHVRLLDPVPYPSVADIGYLLPYPVLIAAVLKLAWPELRTISRGVFLDGLVGALAVAVAGSIITVNPVISSLSGSTFVRIVGGTYPCADLALTALIVGVMTLKAGRPGATWLWLGSGVVTFAVADTVYLYRVADGSYQVGTLLDGLWALGLNLMAISVVVPYRPGGRPLSGIATQLVIPHFFSCVAVAILVYGALSNHRLPVYAVILATLTLGTAVRRVAEGFSALRLLALSQRQARTDELTQLPNRRHFYEEVQRVLGQRAPADRFGVVILDLDGFKAVNDTFGHHAGDELLRQIGPRLTDQLTPGDVLARLGGDEFAVLMRDHSDLVARAERLRAALSRPFLIEGAVQNISASIGIAECPADGVDLAVLLQRADAAMFDAKRERGGVAVFDRDQHGLEREHVNVYEALVQHQLVVHYQPQFHAGTGQLTGVEALVRWQHPDRGLIYPDAFLAFFEHAGLMTELTLEVLITGARDLHRWRLEGLDIGLSVNVAPSVLLHDDLAAVILEVLDQQGVPASALTVEITENVILLDVERSLRALDQLRAAGVRLSLDDYGTGYCSLTYLRDLPLHEVKIDRSFVMQLVPRSADAAIVASSIELAHQLGLSTVAEGVETELSLTMLRSMGCDVVQGYLLGRPIPAADLLRAARSQDGRSQDGRSQGVSSPAGA